MGTPDFAEASLHALLDAGMTVSGVFTQPDKPRGRGMKESPSPVKSLAMKNGIPVFQPVTFKDGAATEILRSLEPDLLVVVAYGRILPQSFLDVPRMGCINLHGSLLPKYRGAAPIQWAVLNGDRVTGVSVQYMAAAMDAGDVIASRETDIGEFETAGELFERLKDLGAELLVETVLKIGAGDVVRIPQIDADATYTKMLDKSMSPIDWTMKPRQIIKHICGLDPWPVATTELDGREIRVFKAEYTDTVTALDPGKIVSAGREGIEISCGGGSTVRIVELQPAGKKRMSAAAYLLGHPLKIDE